MENLHIKEHYKFFIASVSANVNNLDLDNESKEKLLNSCLNVFVNTLAPEYSMIFLDALMTLSEENKKIYKELEVKEAINDITRGMTQNGKA